MQRIRLRLKTKEDETVSAEADIVSVSPQVTVLHAEWDAKTETDWTVIHTPLGTRITQLDRYAMSGEYLNEEVELVPGTPEERYQMDLEFSVSNGPTIYTVVKWVTKLAVPELEPEFFGNSVTELTPITPVWGNIHNN